MGHFGHFVVAKFSPHDEWKGVGVSSTLVVGPQTNGSCVGISDFVHNPLVLVS
jgi:hypothetical protein